MVNEKPSVAIIDLKMPFLSMVVFMIKWAIAAIPAAIVLGILCAIIAWVVMHFVGVPMGGLPS